MTSAFSFQVLNAQRIPSVGIVAVAVRRLDGNICSGARVAATIGGREVELRINSVALEGGRSVRDDTMTLSVTTDEMDLAILVGAIFRGC